MKLKSQDAIFNTRAVTAALDDYYFQCESENFPPKVENFELNNIVPIGRAVKRDRALPPMRISEWEGRDIRPPDFLMGNWLGTTTRAMTTAATGLGKPNFHLAIAMHAAAGVDFLRWKCRRPCRVLYLDGEMSRGLFQQRIKDAARRLGQKPQGFYALSHEDIPDFKPLSTSEGQSQIDHIISGIGGVDLVVFDSVMCLLVGDMKDEESWQQTMPWVRSLTGRNIGQIWIHHTGHDASRGYGTKTREWQLDTVLHMDAVRRSDTDISFSLKFSKARERAPATRSDFQPIEVALANNTWSCRAEKALRSAGHRADYEHERDRADDMVAIQSRLIAELKTLRQLMEVAQPVIERRTAGENVRDIARSYNVSHSTISRLPS